jgi:3-oxoacyl-[acyl-carrier protein] reductase
MRSEGKVAIVTGGGKGIGRAYIRGLAAEGAQVVAADIDEAAAKDTEAEIMDKGGGALGIGVDVSSESSVATMVESTLQQFGRVDVLVNNAGLFSALANHSWEEITADEWDRVMAVNAKGVFLCSKAVLPHMRSQRGGSIINISSGTVIGGAARLLHYVSSKAAVMGFTRALAREVGEFGVRVNTVAPGYTASEDVITSRGMESLERVVERRSLKKVQYPEDIVGTVVFLASEDSAFISGQMIVVDGGASLH